jgi:hypothetical protein
MAITKLRTPAGGPSIIDRALFDLRGPAAAKDMLGGAETKRSEPLPVYRLELQDISGSKFLDKAKPVGWRYLIERADGVAYADLMEGSPGHQTFARLARNRNAERLNAAAQLAEKAAEPLPDCEARILDIPALHIATIWLFGPVQTFIPYIDPEMLADEKASVKIDKTFVSRVAKRASELRGLLDQQKG